MSYKKNFLMQNHWANSINFSTMHPWLFIFVQPTAKLHVPKSYQVEFNHVLCGSNQRSIF